MSSLSEAGLKPRLSWGLAGLLLVALWFFLFYWRAASGLGMFYFGDIARFFYPTRVLYAQALQQGHLPLWAPELLMGFPLFAEMQTGALYPPHLVLYRFFPVDLAINYDILLHLAFLAVGVYVLARARRVSRPGSVVAALAFTAGGFGAGRITHMSVLAVAAWLPWMLLMFERWRTTTRFRYWFFLVLVLGVQLLAGHPQFIFLNVLILVLYAAGSVLNLLDDDPASAPSHSLKQRIGIALLGLLAVGLGGGIAGVQLWPTAELAQASARAGGVSQDFITEFSYHPLYLALLVDPFVLGNPYPRVSVEVVAYLGALPLQLAILAAFFRRKRSTYFWLAVVLGSFVLALGGYNPLYRGMRFLPLLNFFRVPARFLYPMSFALAMLAGLGFDYLWPRATAAAAGKAAFFLAACAGVAAIGISILAQMLSVDVWIETWRVLAPLLFAASLLVILRAWSGRLAQPLLAAFALGLTVVDLAAFGAVYAQTYNVIAPRAEIFGRPLVLDQLDLSSLARTRTEEWIYPWVPEMRESLYPNLNAAYGVQGAQGYTPLIPRRTRDFLDHLSPGMLNLTGVKYFLVPQVLPVDAQREGADLGNPFMADPVDRTLEFMPTEATGLEIESALSQSVDLQDGAVVAIIHVTTEDGQDLTVPLRAGFDTAEWAYERTDVRRVVKHSEPRIATTFPARSAFPPESHPGHFYLADLSFSAAPVSVKALRIEPIIQAGLIHIQKMTLTQAGVHIPVAVMVGKSDHQLVYRSGDVAVWENPDYGQRAFLTHSAYVSSDADALAAMQSPNFSGEVLIDSGPELQTDAGQGLDERVTITDYQPDRVALDVQAHSEGYLVLADAWDPGWVALVDGQPAPIRRADTIFRAVIVDGGQHRVEFIYRPFSFYGGLVVSGVSLALLGMITGLAWLFNGRTGRPVI